MKFGKEKCEYSSFTCVRIQINDYLCNPKLSDNREIERRLSFITTGFRLARTDFEPNIEK